MADTTIKQRHERQAKAIAAYDRSLAAQRERQLQAPDNTSIEFLSGQVLAHFSQHVVRDMSSFRPIKTKDVGARRLAIAAHMFGKFPVPRHLSEVWATPVTDPTNGQRGYVRFQQNERAEDARLKDGFTNREEIVRIHWYIAAATGGSLHKLHTNTIFTKKETHAFLTCPLKLNFRESIIYAMGTTHTRNVGDLTRLAKSKLSDNLFLTNVHPEPVNIPYARHAKGFALWKDVVRFLAVNPVPISTVNDLIDFLESRFHEDEDYNLKGRTLESLTGQMQQWHRDLGRVKRLGNRNWNGIDILDVNYPRDGKVQWRKDIDWAFTQLRTSKALASEGNKMHHCVYSYQSLCIQGKCAIWSLTRNGDRAITLEMRGNDIVQIRGYANRMARIDEIHAIRHWASENNINMPRHY